MIRRKQVPYRLILRFPQLKLLIELDNFIHNRLKFRQSCESASLQLKSAKVGIHVFGHVRQSDYVRLYLVFHFIALEVLVIVVHLHLLISIHADI